MLQIDLFKTEEDLLIEQSEKFILELENEIEKIEQQLKFLNENKAFDWEKEFPQCCDENCNWIGFDAIIGNPPYIYSRNKYFSIKKIFVTKNYVLLMFLKNISEFNLKATTIYNHLSEKNVSKIQSHLDSLNFDKK